MSNFIEQICPWLDTQTRELLCGERPVKAIASGIEPYSLLLLRHGNDNERTEDIVSAIQKQNPILLSKYPFVVAQEMTLDEALAGQFALACCDCISAFVRDEFLLDAEWVFLKELNEQVIASRELEPVSVQLLNIPNTLDGRRFCWQFLGMATGIAIQQTTQVFRKKARLMEHWAKKSHVDLRIVDSN